MSFIQELVRSGGMKLEAKDNRVVVSITLTDIANQIRTNLTEQAKQVVDVSVQGDKLILSIRVDALPNLDSIMKF
jgi:tRNA threonylcarbamoyladenosine modification (KEOPS) complex  Pcc1 subunit